MLDTLLAGRFVFGVGPGGLASANVLLPAWVRSHREVVAETCAETGRDGDPDDWRVAACGMDWADADLARRSMRLMAEEVVPALGSGARA